MEIKVSSLLSNLRKKYVRTRISLKKREEQNQYHKMVSSWLKNIEVVKEFTPEQKREIQDYYRQLIGEEICLDSHKYFYTRTGVFSKNYVPKYLYHTELVNKANDMRVRFIANKNFVDIIFHDVNQPKIILKNINGYYYYNHMPVSREDAISLCKDLRNAVIKPARGTHGNGVKVFDVSDGVTTINGKTLSQVFDAYKVDFQIQEKFVQHADMAALNPTSVNTLRMLTYRSGMEILLIYSVVRIGRSGQVIDNQCAGGLSTSVDKNGCLGKYSFGGYYEDNITRTDTGIELEGYQLPSFEKAVEFVKKLHFRVPYFDLVGWDIAIDENGEPALIEWNTDPGLSQSAFGSGFGEYTERVIKELWPKPNYLYDC